MAKVVLGIGFFKVGAFRFVAEISSPDWGSISVQNLVSAFALYLFSATKRDKHTPTVERKKNVTMDKMKIISR